MYGWIPAGCTNKTLALYVKLKKTFDAGMSYKEYYQGESKIYELNLPDRIVYVSSACNRIDVDCDWCESLDWKLDTADGSSFDISLVSAENLLKKDTVTLDKRKDHRIFVDSGGAQLRFATTNFVDPYRVIDVYNKIGDMGTALDVPPRPCDFSVPSAIKCAQYIQRKNNEIFAERAKKDLLLLNCVHGNTLDDNLRWAEAVHNDRFTGWAFGVTDINFVTKVIKIINMIFKLGQAEHYHLFGFGSNLSIAVFSYLGKYVNNITSDSTTYLQAASFREMQFLTDSGKLFRDRIAGNKIKFNKVDYSLSPCSCAACRNLKYLKAYTLDCGVVGRLMQYHNAVAMSNFAKMCSNLAMRYNAYDYYKFFENAYAGDRVFLSALLDSVKVIDKAFLEGIEKVEKSYLLRNQPKDRVKLNGLFDFGAADTDDDNEKLNNATGVAAFDGMWSLQADIAPRYLTKEKMDKFGVDWNKIIGLKEWKDYETYARKKNSLSFENIWLADYLSEKRDAGEYPIKSYHGDIIKEHSIPMLKEHCEYPMNKKSVKSLLERLDNQFNHTKKKFTKRKKK